MAVRCLHAWCRRRETHSETPYPSAKPTIRAIAISSIGGRANFQEARQWLRGSKERVKVTCERGLPMLPREWVRRLKRDVALSPLGAFGGKSIREHRIQARSQRSERLQFQASGVIGQRFPAVTVPASNAELRSRHHGLARMRARGPVRARSGPSGRMTATSDSSQRTGAHHAMN
jgi:hypothetical protein